PALLGAASASGRAGHSGTRVAYLLIYSLAVVTAFLTALYTGRAFFRTFFGPLKLPSPDDPETVPSGQGYAGSGSPAESRSERPSETDPHRRPHLPPAMGNA